MPERRLIHIVDDDPDFRRSLEALLASAGYETVAYESAAAVLGAKPGLASGCLLLDVRMPGMDGLELQNRLNASGCRLPVIVMTGQGDVPTAVRALKAGAVDFIEKPFDDEPLLRAVEAAFEARAGRAARERTIAEAEAMIAGLSPRERQVLEGVAAGHSNKMIAYDLDISVRTVEVHRARMLERLGVRNIAGAVRIAVMAGLSPGVGKGVTPD